MAAITGAVAGGSREGAGDEIQQIPLVQTNIRRHGRKSFPTYHTHAAQSDFQFFLLFLPARILGLRPSVECSAFVFDLLGLGFVLALGLLKRSAVSPQRSDLPLMRNHSYEIRAASLDEAVSDVRTSIDLLLDLLR